MARLSAALTGAAGVAAGAGGLARWERAVGGVGMCHLQFRDTLATPRHPPV